MTTTINPDTATAQATLDAVGALAPRISSRAAEIEAARRLPRDLLDELTAAGCFRILLPASHGGLGADLPTAMTMLEALSRADASVGWTVGIGSSSWIDLAGLPRATFDELFPPGEDVIVAGAFNPSGGAAPVDGGYRVAGRWSFASGCEHARWIFGNCVELAGGAPGAPSGGPPGPPALRMAVFSPSEVTIEDTWYVSGLCGTGSQHFSVEDVLVPAERTFPTLAHEPCLDEPVVRIPAPQMFALELSSVALGIARGAVDDVVALATGKVPLLAPATLATNPHFQHQLATADTEVRAARALVHAAAEEAWATAVAGGEFTPEHRARIRAAGAWATARAAAAVDTAYLAGGGSSLYADSPLQRRFRDIHAVTQHFLVKPDTFTTAGAVYAGQEIQVPVF